MKTIFKTSVLILFSASLLTLSSCSKDDDSEPTPPVTVKSKITNKEWKGTDYSVTVNGEAILTYANVPACTKDDITMFLDDFTGTVDEGSTKCDPGDPQSSSFTWSLVSSDKQIRYEKSGDITVYDIKINNGTILKLEYQEVGDFNNDGQNDTGIIALTFTKQ